MLKLIGKKRTILLSIFLGLNLLLGLIYLAGVSPLQEQASMEEATLTNEIRALQGKILTIKQEVADFKETYPKYQALDKKGFFAEQDRFKLSRDIDALRDRSGIQGFSYNIDDIKEMQSAEADQVQKRMIMSRVEIKNITALFDTHVFEFIRRLGQEFPAHTRVSVLKIYKKTDVNEATLKSIREGNKVDLLTAEASFDWLTLVPKPEPVIDPATGAPIP